MSVTTVKALMLYLDFDLYEPSKVTLETFVPKMPKGGIIVLDELTAKMFAGETVAVYGVLGVNGVTPLGSPRFSIMK